MDVWIDSGKDAENSLQSRRFLPPFHRYLDIDGYRVVHLSWDRGFAPWFWTGDAGQMRMFYSLCHMVRWQVKNALKGKRPINV